MKPITKVVFFLAILAVFDFLFRKGLIGFAFPLALPSNLTALLFYTIFAIIAYLVTRWLANSDRQSMADLGISFDSKNRLEFFYGLFLGIVLWGLVSICQSFIAGFSWTLRPSFNYATLLNGLLFIFIADLGTELWTRGYPLRRLEEKWGALAAIFVMTVFVAIKSFSLQASGELLFFIVLIPALHTIFFSIIYFKTGRLGAAVGLHTGANFATISIFDLRIPQESQAIPSGLFQADRGIENLSMTALQFPYVFMALVVTLVVYFWWRRA